MAAGLAAKVISVCWPRAETSRNRGNVARARPYAYSRPLRRRRRYEREQDGHGDGHGGRRPARPVHAVVRPAGLGRGPDRRAPVQAAAGPAADRVVLSDARRRRRRGGRRRRLLVPGVRDGRVDGTAAAGRREMVHVLDDFRRDAHGAAARPHRAGAGAVLQRGQGVVVRLVFRARPEQRVGRRQPVPQPPPGRQTTVRVPPLSPHVKRVRN